MIPYNAVYKSNTISFEIPEGYEDLTLGQYIDRLKWDGEDILDLVKTMTGLGDEVIRNTDTEYVMNTIVSRLGWLKTPPSFMFTEDTPEDKRIELPVPSKINIDKYVVVVPKDIEFETYGQKISLQIHIKMSQKEELTVVEIIPFCLAIYLQPVLEGRKYDEDRARRLIPKILEMNFVDAYSVGSFFLDNLTRLLKGKTSKSPVKRTGTRLLRILRNFNLSRFMGRSTVWQGGTSSNMTRSFYNRIGMYM